MAGPRFGRIRAAAAARSGSSTWKRTVSSLNVAQKFGSCHTALIGGYAVEGHVSAREIVRLLKERPQTLGLAVCRERPLDLRA
ncbi:DUF411 domain-containing protein [Ramlibacter aurantiacus]|uniref:DUF411 domain-containing protein n=1 Tax=Ramlibacter aurantiacus TaxID=2801330 RepID=UPI00338E48A2